MAQYVNELLAKATRRGPVGHLVTDWVTAIVNENVEIFTHVKTCLDHIIIRNISEHVLNRSMECLLSGTLRGTGLNNIEASYN